MLRRRAKLAAFAAQAVLHARVGGEHAISGVRAWTVREPVSKRRYSVLRLETASGLKGYGEPTALAAAEVAEARRALTGTAATAVEPACVALRAWLPLQAAVNMAMLDVAGKLAKAPVYQVLGGPTRNKARALAPLAGDTDAAGHRPAAVRAQPGPGRTEARITCCNMPKCRGRRARPIAASC